MTDLNVNTYKKVISERADDFLKALDGAGRVTVNRPNALGDWDSETFSPEAVKCALRKEAE